MDSFSVSEKYAGMRLDCFLKESAVEFSRTRIQALLREGAVTRENFGRVRDPSYIVRIGECYGLVCPPIKENPFPQPQSIALDIVHEDTDLLVINKPAGLVVHPAPGHPDRTLVNALLAHCGDSLSGIGGIKRPGIVHRLDKGTSGLLVVAKHDQAHQFLQKQFLDRSLSRMYHAFVRGVPPIATQTLTQSIGRHHRNRQKYTVKQRGGKEAQTHYTIETAYPPHASLLRCHLGTGRTHQIRVHLSALGYPVIGDTLYGRKSEKEVGKLPEGRLALHATSLSFIHPADLELRTFDTILPTDLLELKYGLEAI